MNPHLAADLRVIAAPPRLVASAAPCACELGGAVLLEGTERQRLRCPACGLATPWNATAEEALEDWRLGRLLLCAGGEQGGRPAPPHRAAEDRARCFRSEPAGAMVREPEASRCLSRRTAAWEGEGRP